MLLTRTEFNDKKKAWEQAFLKTCDGDPKTFKKAEETMNDLIDSLSFEDAKEKDEFLTLVACFKDTNDVLTFADKVFERNYAKRTEKKTIQELFNFYKRFPAYQSEMLKQLSNFEKAYKKLDAIFTNEILFDCNDFICDDYPFELSFGDHNISSWIENIKNNLTNKRIDMKESVKNSFTREDYPKYDLKFLETFVSFVNNSLEKDYEYWASYFGDDDEDCDGESIVDQHGFGYDDEGNLEMIEGDNLVPLMVIQKDLEELYNFFKDKPLEDTRILIEWLMLLLED